MILPCDVTERRLYYSQKAKGQRVEELALLAQVANEGAVKIGNVEKLVGKASLMKIESEWTDHQPDVSSGDAAGVPPLPAGAPPPPAQPIILPVPPALDNCCKDCCPAAEDTPALVPCTTESDQQQCPDGQLQTVAQICKILGHPDVCPNQTIDTNQQNTTQQQDSQCMRVMKHWDDHFQSAQPQVTNNSCWCDAVWASCRPLPLNYNGGSYDVVAVPVTASLATSTSAPAADCPVRVFLLDMQPKANPDYKHEVRKFQAHWNDEQLTTDEGVAPFLDQLIRQSPCRVYNVRDADVVYIAGFLGPFNSRSAPNLRDIAWLGGWLTANTQPYQALFVNQQSVSEECVQELFQARLRLKEEWDKHHNQTWFERFFYSTREGNQEACVAQRCVNHWSSGDKGLWQVKPPNAEVTDVLRNHATKIAPTAIVLPYIANTGLRALLATPGSKQFLLNNSRPIDLFFKGMVERMNCGFRTRKTVAIACQEFSMMSFSNHTSASEVDSSEICQIGTGDVWSGVSKKLGSWKHIRQFRVQCSSWGKPTKVEFDEGAISSKFCIVPRGDSPSTSQVCVVVLCTSRVAGSV
jgi:hypothetical protein